MGPPWREGKEGGGKGDGKGKGRGTSMGSGGKGRGGGRGGGYDWRKHLPEGHPARSGRDCSQEDLGRYQTDRWERQSVEDAEVMERVARHAEEQLEVAPLSEEEQAMLARQADERKLRALARDPNPSQLWMSRADGEALDVAIHRAAQAWSSTMSPKREAEEQEKNNSRGGPRKRGISTTAEQQEQQERLHSWVSHAAAAGETHRRGALPAWSSRQEVVTAVRGRQVVVVSGETGCGKSTQVPQFILDDAIVRGEGGSTNIPA